VTTEALTGSPPTDIVCCLIVPTAFKSEATALATLLPSAAEGGSLKSAVSAWNLLTLSGVVAGASVPLSLALAAVGGSTKIGVSILFAWF
jgi:hypothetical protein